VKRFTSLAQPQLLGLGRQLMEGRGALLIDGVLVGHQVGQADAPMGADLAEGDLPLLQVPLQGALPLGATPAAEVLAGLQHPPRPQPASSARPMQALTRKTLVIASRPDLRSTKEQHPVPGPFEVGMGALAQKCRVVLLGGHPRLAKTTASRGTRQHDGANNPKERVFYC